MPLRVLWVIDGLGPGGAENLMPPLIHNLAGWDVLSRVCVLQSRFGNPIAEMLAMKGVPVDLVPLDNLHSPRQLAQFFRYVKSNKPDILHTQLETSDVLGGFASRYFNLPCVSTIHTLTMPGKKMTSRFRLFLRNFCLRYLIDKVIVVSEATRNHYLHLGMKEEALVTIYNGIELERYAGTRSRARGEVIPGVGEDEIVLLTVAVLREAKGIQDMLRALPMILKAYPNARYVIAGDGEYRGALEELARSLGVAGRVILLGYRNDIPELLAASDVFMFPTLIDAFPTVLLEALAAGTPVIASQVGGVPEIIFHERNGLLTPASDPSRLADTCIRLLSDSSLADRLKSAGREDAGQRFNIKKQVETLYHLYLQVISERQRWPQVQKPV